MKSGFETSCIVPDNNSYVQFLRSKSGKRVYVKPYNGNSGDMLIFMGTEVLLDSLGINRVRNPNDADLILWPGGNPTMWDSNIAGWRECWDRWPNAEFVVGPSTFREGRSWRSLLEGATVKISGLFARDESSYEMLNALRTPPYVAIGLGHDPAFYLRGTRIISEMREGCSEDYVLACFRGDHESAGSLDLGPWVTRNALLNPLVCRYRNWRLRMYKRDHVALVRQRVRTGMPVVEQDASMLSYHAFVECISRAAEVHTDRLHCMIFALLLGKPVVAYPTAYGKLESVYNHSIASWAKVEFVRA